MFVGKNVPWHVLTPILQRWMVIIVATKGGKDVRRCVDVIAFF
ncbi:hypothetical protein ARMA_1914 [Ardenticatena maritima]|uniref:Uncharacterized protein n=1 Tax=Ardenticatena maritima TaxID=872965 RepID=A0A0M8K9A9_9CHLR|nr:hypothetical protein ARMA_1914 [Ardenticatena maritima]